jgi:hypothetical protein
VERFLAVCAGEAVVALDARAGLGHASALLAACIVRRCSFSAR